MTTSCRETPARTRSAPAPATTTSTAVSFYGFGGADDINTQDGFGGDWISADSLGPGSTCVGDPGDEIHCESELS